LLGLGIIGMVEGALAVNGRLEAGKKWGFQPIHSDYCEKGKGKPGLMLTPKTLKKGYHERSLEEKNGWQKKKKKRSTLTSFRFRDDMV